MTTAEYTSPATAALSVRESIRNWALIALILYVANGIAFAGFSAVGGIWFTISDAFGLLLAVALLILVIRFDDLLRPLVGSLSRNARWIGVIAMGLGIAGSVVLVSSQVGHEFLPAGGGLGMQFLGWGLLGVWFLMVGLMGQRTELFSRRWVWAAYIAGGGSVLAMLGSIPLGPDSIAVSLGFTVTFIAIVLWVIWTRKELCAA